MEAVGEDYRVAGHVEGREEVLGLGALGGAALRQAQEQGVERPEVVGYFFNVNEGHGLGLFGNCGEEGFGLLVLVLGTGGEQEHRKEQERSDARCETVS